MTSRRMFLKHTGGLLTLFAAGASPWSRQAIAQVPGGSLDPAAIPKFVTPLLVPPVMPKADTLVLPGGKPADYYEISVRQFPQQILPAGLPATTVWGYGAVASTTRSGLRLHNAPSLTIEAKWNRPVRVKWINDLKDASGNHLPHLLPVDPTLHWANPPGGTAGRDTRPTFTSTPGRYTGPVPMVTHVHGAAGVADDSDGHAEAWYLPAAADLPAGHAVQGTWHDFFKSKAQASYGVSWGPGFATFQYPNLNRASTLWYHDHTLGMTRLNVYAGPAGFYLVRGGPAGDAAVLDARTGQAAALPGPAPRDGDRFPPNKTYFEIPIAIQDRSFNADGSLFYPDSRAFFDGIEGPYLPHSDVPPIWNPEFFGNAIMVNGNTWPFHTVQRRRYRLRLLNGCNARFLILDFSGVPGISVWQIGNEGGFLAAPVNLTANHANRLLMSPAERADLIVDFTQVPVGDYELLNMAPDEPFGGGQPGVDFEPADPATTGRILQWRVVSSAGPDPSTPPQFLELPVAAALPASTRTRRVALMEDMSAVFDDAPVEARAGIVTGVGDWGELTALPWKDAPTETPATGTTETWEIYNATGDAHPVHIHEVVFEVVNRQALEIHESPPRVRLQPGSQPRPREPWESGFKDTVVAFPGEVTRVKARFDTPGQFVWHCHLVEHEDNEMMRPYRIGPVQPGQPGP